MKELIEDFTNHITESIQFSNSATLSPFNEKIENVLICGLGGSGIGGTIISQVITQDATCPIIINKDYKIPAFVSKNTLVLCCSYSGNTEESLEMLVQAEAKGAVIACVTSGGKLADISKSKNYNHILIPSGHPPRAAFGLAFPPLFYILKHYNVISDDYVSQFNNTIKTINSEEENVIAEAKTITEKLYNKIPVIYADANYEMNHNELVGWTKENNDLAVVLFRNDDDYFRTQKRMEVNKTVFEKYTSTIIEIYSKGNSQLEKAMYLLHLGDWISYLLAEKKGIDVTEVDVITYLKGELAKI